MVKRVGRAAVYVRISDDRDGTGLGVERQREDCLALVESRGWELVNDGMRDVFEDNDKSAYSGKPRPAYLRLMESLRNGDIDVVVAWHPDRLHRSPRELEDFLDALNGATVETVRAGMWDLSTPSGKLVARQLGAVARYESEQKSDRVRRAMLQRAESGKPHGQLRTYGIAGVMTANGKTKTYAWSLVEPEATVLREAAQRVLGGEALWSVVDDLRRRKVPTLRGGQWSRTTLRQMLVSARIAGWREHTPGRSTSGHEGQWDGGDFTHEAPWPAIIPRADVERLRVVLSEPSRRQLTSPRSYLLSGGLLRCSGPTPLGPDATDDQRKRRAERADCAGKSLSGRPSNDGYLEYQCATSTGGCGRTARADRIEGLVIDSVRAAIDDGSLAGLQASMTTGAAQGDAHRIEHLERELNELAADYGSQRISRAEWTAARTPMNVDLERLKRDHSRKVAAESGSTPSPTDLAAWDKAWLAAADRQPQRRALLTSAIEHVTVLPARRGDNRFNPDRFPVVWRTE